LTILYILIIFDSMGTGSSKKRAVWAVLFFLLVTLNKTAFPKENFKPKLSIILKGGMNYLSAGDINKGLLGFSDAWSDQATSLGGYVEGEAKTIHIGYEFEGDVVINLTPKLGIGIGAGYIQGERASEISSSGSIEGICTYTSKIIAIPLRLGMFYILPMSKRMNIVFNAGIGMYLTQCNYDLLSSLGGLGFLSSIQKSSSDGFGFHGGVGFEFKVASNFSFVLEGKGRYVKIGGFEGTNRYPGGLKEGTLYYFELTTSTGNYPRIDIETSEPDGSEYDNVREANIDFSGISFFTGIKITF
jgi:hypothetical protein